MSFGALEEDDCKHAIDQIMLRVAAISGCALPNTEFFAKFISEEIQTFIMDFGYAILTLEEIILAFRFNAKGGLKWPNGETVDYIPFSGHCVNVDYISKVLSTYMSFRNILDRKLQNQIDGYEL